MTLLLSPLQRIVIGLLNLSQQNLALSLEKCPKYCSMSGMSPSKQKFGTVWDGDFELRPLVPEEGVAKGGKQAIPGADPRRSAFFPAPFQGAIGFLAGFRWLRRDGFATG